MMAWKAQRAAPKAAARNGESRTARPALTEDQIQQKIRERAYLFFEKRGCVHGFADQDWVKAESQIRKELRAS